MYYNLILYLCIWNVLKNEIKIQCILNVGLLDFMYFDCIGHKK